MTSGIKTLMQKLNIKKYLEIFDIKRVKIMNDIIGKKTIINLPEDFICYVGDDGAISFEKFEATFSEIEGYLVFSVCVDDFLWIDKNYKTLSGSVTALQNILDEIVALYLKTIYKLKFLK